MIIIWKNYSVSANTNYAKKIEKNLQPALALLGSYRYRLVTSHFWEMPLTDTMYSKHASVRECYNHCVPERARWMKKGNVVSMNAE